MDNVSISVIIPTYKRNNMIDRAIESVLKQSGDFEVIVVDDNDSFSEYRKSNEIKLSKYFSYSNFKYIKHEKNMNGATARNTGIKASRGKYITFLDDDDEFLDNRIKVIEECITKQNEPDFICTGVILKKNDEIIKKIIPPIDNKSNKEIQIDLLNQKPVIITGSNMICKREIIRKIGGFDTSFIRHQDIEFLIRYLEYAYKIVVINQYLVIKNCDDSTNMPNLEKLKKIKDDFLNKFDYIIKELDEKQQKEILKNNYYHLLNISYDLYSKKEIKEVREMLIKKKIYSRKYELKLYLKKILRENRFSRLFNKNN